MKRPDSLQLERSPVNRRRVSLTQDKVASIRSDSALHGEIEEEEEEEEEKVQILREDLRHRQFQYRHGSKLHCFPRAEAPWPFAYDREVLEQSLIDSPLVEALRSGRSFVEYHGTDPKRCLDLGTALGNWVIDTAKLFPECTFVGLDLVDVQIDLKYVDSSIAKRVTWSHVNFLKFPLPFEDNEFDYIHLSGIGLAVPEHKWIPLFEELNRILSPGGVIEMLQQDARFPVLPRWFTDPLHKRMWQEHQANESKTSHAQFIPIRDVSPDVPHVYALLEELYYSVFESRFINPTPGSILPNYFTSVFSKVISPPILRISMPPIAPPTMKIRQMPPMPSSATTSDPLDASAYFVPNSEDQPETAVADSASTSSITDDSVSARSSSTFATSVFRELDIPCDNKSSLQHVDEKAKVSEPQPTQSRLSTPLDRIRTTSLFEDSDGSRSPSLSTQRLRTSSTLSLSSPRRERPAAQLALQDATQLGGEAVTALFRVDRLLKMGDGALFMHLYQASRMVFAAKEAMWDELMARVEAKDQRLTCHGWRLGEDYNEKESRRKFEGIFGRYKHDIYIRLSFWHELLKQGWVLPAQASLTAAELLEEDQLRQDVLEARKGATEEEFNTPVRSLRLLIGVKGS